MGQNIRTQAVLDFIDPQQTLPGFPPEAAKVEFVWAANDIGTEVQTILVVARDSDHVLWSYSIDDAGETGGDVLIFPTREPDDDQPLVTPKNRPSEEIAEGE